MAKQVCWRVCQDEKEKGSGLSSNQVTTAKTGFFRDCSAKTLVLVAGSEAAVTTATTAWRKLPALRERRGGNPHTPLASAASRLERDRVQSPNPASGWPPSRPEELGAENGFSKAAKRRRKTSWRTTPSGTLLG